MDENRSESIEQGVKQYSPYAPPEKKTREKVAFTPREAIALVLALGLALLWFEVYGIDGLFRDGLPGLGTAAFAAAMFASAFIYLGREVRVDLQTAAYMAGMLALCVCCCVFGDMWLRAINGCIIFSLSAAALMRISGHGSCAWNESRIIPETVRLSLKSLFINVDKPFRAAAGADRSQRKLLGQVMVGILAVIPVAAVVMALLSSADAVFKGTFEAVGRWMREAGLKTILWKIVRTLAAGLMAFSALYFMRGKKKESEKRDKSALAAPTVPFAAALVVLDCVYLLFAVIQFTYLFGGNETAAMEGGYAQYARNGFFELAAVAVINVGITLLTASLPLSRTDSTGKERLLLRILSFLLLALTGVILVSAVWRMRLYISEYGMTLLRAMTLWGMALTAVCLAAAGVKLVRCEFRFFGVLFAASLAGWIIFNGINIDARIAEHNVDAYLSGELKYMDTAYLADLSADTLPALRRLEEATGKKWNVAETEAGVRMKREKVSWTGWDLSLFRYVK